MHLCVSCSMCCDGTLFSRLTILPKEEKLFGPQAKFFELNGGRRMRLGCTELGNDGACGLYENRPANCRSFKCELLLAQEAGTIDDTKAKSIANEAKLLRQRALDMTLTALPNETSNGIGTLSSARAELSKFRKQSEVVHEYSLREADLHFDIFVRFVRAHMRPNFRRSWKT
jgi:uncharacterized protein